MTAPVPALVLGGYLGSGKTTLVNHILRHADGQRIGVLVNDFGDINIDADLIQGQAGDVMELSGGCVCCSFGADLVGSLMTLAQRQPVLDLPGAVARSAKLALGIAVVGVVVVLDGQTCRERASDTYVGSTVMQQLHDADLLVLNKLDLCNPNALAGTRDWLLSLGLKAPVLESAHAAVPPGFWLGMKGQGLLGNAWLGSGRLLPDGHQASQQFESRRWHVGPSVDLARLVSALDAMPGVLRAKGFVTDPNGVPWVLNKVGAASSLVRQTHAAAHSGELVLIGVAGAMPVLPELSHLCHENDTPWGETLT